MVGAQDGLAFGQHRFPTGLEQKHHDQAMKRRVSHHHASGANDYFWVRLVLGFVKLPLSALRLITRRKGSS
jgi:hypothetical protein